MAGDWQAGRLLVLKMSPRRNGAGHDDTVHVETRLGTQLHAPGCRSGARAAQSPLVGNLALKRLIGDGALPVAAHYDLAVLDTPTGRYVFAHALLVEAGEAWEQAARRKANSARGNRNLLHGGQLLRAEGHPTGVVERAYSRECLGVVSPDGSRCEIGLRASGHPPLASPRHVGAVQSLTGAKRAAYARAALNRISSWLQAFSA